jgi:hypothetical protein
MSKTRIATALCMLCAAFAATNALAQSDTLSLHLSRDWGYGGFNGDIQGNFTIEASGAPDVTRVEFYVDDIKIGEASQAPFRLQFVTDNYPAGKHALHAVGHTVDGRSVPSQTLTRLFLSSSDANQSTMGIVAPILVIAFGGMLLAALIPILLIPKSRRLGMGSPLQYLLGGGFCPRCNRPFRFHVYGVKLGGAKYDRCPYCGKWSVVPRAALEALIAAERAEQNQGMANDATASAQGALKKELEDSKYQDL